MLDYRSVLHVSLKNLGVFFGKKTTSPVPEYAKNTPSESNASHVEVVPTPGCHNIASHLCCYGKIGIDAVVPSASSRT